MSPSVTATWRMLSPNRATVSACASRQPRGGARPDADPLAHARLAPVADDRLPHEAHPRLHERELPVAVRGLVQVHEVHVDLGPGEIAVVLRVQVQEGPLEGGEPGDPHLRRRERVHPGDHADAARARVGLDEHGPDRLRRRRDRLADDAHRDLGLRRRARRRSRRACASTLRSCSAPYMCWLPQTNQASRCPSASGAIARDLVELPADSSRPSARSAPRARSRAPAGPS